MTRKRKGSKSLPTDWLGDPLQQAEAAMWATLSVPHRAKAIQRMGALDRWIGAEGTTDVKQAAADAGVSVTRMYEMGKAWRARRSLASLGTFAAAPKTRLGKHEGAIRRALPSIVGKDPDGSVRKLALDLERKLTGDIPADQMPGHNTFRRYVEEEKRRLKQMTMAGDDLMLDCCACNLTPADPEVVTLFVILDRWTQVVLGAALGDVRESRSGYAMAALDAQRRMERGQFADLPWVDRLSRIEMVVGADADCWDGFKKECSAAGVVAPVELSITDKRFGRYLRQLTGLRIGTLVALPARTSGISELGPRAPVRVGSTEQKSRMSIEVDGYNAAIIGRLKVGERVPPPDDATRFLSLLAAN